MEKVAEQELIEWVRESNYAAFDALYQRHWKPLYLQAAKKTGDKDDAFDLVQDLFIEFWDKRQSIPTINVSLTVYLQGIMVYKLFRYFRAKGFHEKHRKNFEQFLEATEEIALPQEPTDREELIEVIYRTIDELPGRMKEIFIMSRSGQYSISQIAEQLSVSPQTVKNQIHLAYTRLRKVGAEHAITTAELSVFMWLTIN